jgi:uncharacterized protein (DUF952 family)
MTRIFHLTTASAFKAGLTDYDYAPPGWEREGFIHCSPDAETVLAVAKSYFLASTEPVLVLEIETERLRAECRFEAPAPLPGGGAHRTPGKLFPHVYGRIDRAAIVAVGTLQRSGDTFVWPQTWEPLARP